MSAAANSKRSQEAAAALVARGYWHGRRQSVGLSNIPPLTDVGSAAYRRRMKKTPSTSRGSSV